MSPPRTRSMVTVARAHVAASGDSLEARLVYADVLTERGDPRGLFITAQCTGNEDTARELLVRYRKHFLYPLAPTADVEFRNGFVDTWTTNADEFRSAGRKLLRCTPLRRLIIHGARACDVQYAISAVGFEHVRIFELINPWVGALSWLANREALPGLRTLGVIGTWMPEERQALLDSKLRASLETLEFTRNPPLPRAPRLG